MRLKQCKAKIGQGKRVKDGTFIGSWCPAWSKACMTAGSRGPSLVAKFYTSCTRLDMPRMTTCTRRQMLAQ